MKKFFFPFILSTVALVLTACEFTVPSIIFSSSSLATSGQPFSTSASSSQGNLTSLPPPSEAEVDFTTPPAVPALSLASDVCEPNSTPRISENTLEEYQLFFHPTTKVMIDFQMTNAQLKFMNEYGNRTADHDRYVTASMRIDVTPYQGNVISYCYPTVGIRMKGNTSRTDFIQPNGAFVNFINLKVSFASDNPLEPRVPNARFLGMTRLDLKWNRNFDHSQIRQVFAHKLYNEFLPFAQEATIGGVRILQSGVETQYQNNYLGLYTLIEPMDRRFFVRRLGSGPDADGNLYKLLYSATGAADMTKFEAVQSNGTVHQKTGNKIGVEDNPANYHPSYDLKTNTSGATFQEMVNLIGELNASTNVNDASYRARVEQVIDLDTVLMMEAIAYWIGNPDDYRNNANNLYLYFLPSTGKAYPIPYDLDRGLGVNGDWDPTDGNPFGQYGPSMTKATPYQLPLLKDWNFGRVNPLHRLTILSGGYEGYQQQYTENLARIYQSGWLTSSAMGNGNFTGVLYELHQMYRRTYYPTSGNYLYLQPTPNALKDAFVVFSINQKTLKNLTYHEYISAKMTTYLQALS